MYLGMRNSLVAIDTGVACLHGIHVLFTSTRLLCFRIHRGEVVAVPALARIRFLHRLPYITRKRQTFGIKFFRRIYAAQNLMEHLVGGLDLAHNLMNPWPRDMAIGTSRLYTGAVIVMNGFFVFLVDVIFHFMTGDTEIHGVRDFHCGIETTPENNTDNHEDQGRAQCRA